MDDLLKKLQGVQNYLQGDVKKDIGVQAVNFYKKSFRDEGFTDKKLEKWKDVKRRLDKNVKGAASKRKILTGTTKQLADGIDYSITTHGVSISTDVPYAQIHNEGGNAGRNGSAKIPKRQFIGQSDSLNKIVITEIEGEITRMMND